MRSFIIADDHPVTLAGIKSYIEKLGNIVMSTYDNGISAYNNIISLQPDYAILDLSMPGMNGLEVLQKVRATNKSIKIILYTMYHEKSLFEKAVQLGVNGYILKDFALEELAVCLDTLKFKNEWFSPKLYESLIIKSSDSTQEKLLLLSPAERKILSLIADEKSSKTIAELLFIAEKTVENHRSNIIRKLGLSNTKNALLIWAIENKKHIISN
ncbi:MAG TPA: response regulator transcription factor [Chitinophagaceae bacterium]|jgi:DNA-binding NarL/FixJ family response regulator|nr:response regulator transcription factor [Chitinophagaceae bacterium]